MLVVLLPLLLCSVLVALLPLLLCSTLATHPFCCFAGSQSIVTPNQFLNDLQALNTSAPAAQMQLVPTNEIIPQNEPTPQEEKLAFVRGRSKEQNIREEIL